MSNNRHALTEGRALDIVIISEHNYLAETLIHNSVFATMITTLAPAAITEADLRDKIVITDLEQYKDMGGYFPPPLLLKQIIDYIDTKSRKIYLNLQLRHLAIGDITVDLTEKEILLVQAVLQYDNFMAPVDEILKEPSLWPLNFNSLRSLTRRVNQKIEQQGLPMQLKLMQGQYLRLEADL